MVLLGVRLGTAIRIPYFYSHLLFMMIDIAPIAIAIIIITTTDGAKDGRQKALMAVELT